MPASSLVSPGAFHFSNLLSFNWLGDDNQLLCVCVHKRCVSARVCVFKCCLSRVFVALLLKHKPVMILQKSVCVCVCVCVCVRARMCMCVCGHAGPLVSNCALDNWISFQSYKAKTSAFCLTEPNAHNTLTDTPTHTQTNTHTHVEHTLTLAHTHTHTAV